MEAYIGEQSAAFGYILYAQLVLLLKFVPASLQLASILVWFDSTIIDISTILVTMYYSRYVGL